MTVRTKPSLLSRLTAWIPRPPAEGARAIAAEEIPKLSDRIDLGGPGFGTTARFRRQQRTDADIVALLPAIYSAIRRRTRMVAKPRINLVRMRGGEIVQELMNSHPAMEALFRVNEALTSRQGIGLIEQHKLATGKAYWLKRRNGLNVPVEFEIWNPELVRPIRDERKPWLPKGFKKFNPTGSWDEVAFEDVVWFRHLVDPRDPVNGLGPITAMRTMVDTGLEAQRYNQAFFDNDSRPGRIYKVAEGGPAEVDRVRRQLQAQHQGTDNAYRALITEGDIEEVGGPVSHKDMEFIEQHRMTVEEVARVFELSPITLGDLRHASFENVEQSDAHDWAAVADQLDNTLAELTEFYLWPDFGRDLQFIADYDDIPALQGDRKLQAEIDEIHLKNLVVTVNEVRDRDRRPPVPWGDVPLAPLTVGPLAFGPRPSTPSQAAASAAHSRGLVDDGEGLMRAGWSRRLERERDAIIRHLTRPRTARLSQEDVAAYDWDWWQRHRGEVLQELTFTYQGALTEAEFAETPLSTSQELSVRYAEGRTATILDPRSGGALPASTRKQVAKLVGRALEEGASLDQLARWLRDDFAFSRSRAEMIARTETAFAQGEATLTSYQSLGHEGKEWLTAQDERVDGGDPSGPCQLNEGHGPVRVSDAFPSGHTAPPAHPRCRCTLLPVRTMPTPT